MASRRLFFDDLSDSKDESQHGSSSERGVNPSVDIATTSWRTSEATKPLVFEDEPVEAMVGLVETSQPGGNFLKVNRCSCFKNFDMLKIRYMYQIPSSVEIRALLPHACVDWDV